MRIGLITPRGMESPAVYNIFTSLAKFMSDLGYEVIGNPTSEVRVGAANNIVADFIKKKYHLYKRLLFETKPFDVLLIPYPYSLFNPLENPRYIRSFLDIRKLEIKIWRKS